MSVHKIQKQKRWYYTKKECITYPRMGSTGALDVIRREDVLHVLYITSEGDATAGHTGKTVQSFLQNDQKYIFLPKWLKWNMIICSFVFNFTLNEMYSHWRLALRLGRPCRLASPRSPARPTWHDRHYARRRLDFGLWPAPVEATPKGKLSKE